MHKTQATCHLQQETEILTWNDLKQWMGTCIQKVMLENDYKN